MKKKEIDEELNFKNVRDHTYWVDCGIDVDQKMDTKGNTGFRVPIGTPMVTS